MHALHSHAPLPLQKDRKEERGKVMLTRLVLQLVQSFSSLRDFGDVLSHNSNSIVDLGLNLCRLGVAPCGRSRVRRRTATGKIRVIRFGPEGYESRTYGLENGNAVRHMVCVIRTWQ